jgi:hypothetical protein
VVIVAGEGCSVQGPRQNSGRRDLLRAERKGALGAEPCLMRGESRAIRHSGISKVIIAEAN